MAEVIGYIIGYVISQVYKSKYRNNYSENKYLLNTHISYDKLLLTRKLLDLRLV